MIELTDKNFDTEVLNSKDLYLVDFWVEWCLKRFGGKNGI